jgi:hypothetical protein
MARRRKNKASHAKRNDKRLKAVYAKSRAEFTAADLQKFTEVQEGIPFEEIVAELKEMHRKTKSKPA